MTKCTCSNKAVMIYHDQVLQQLLLITTRTLYGPIKCRPLYNAQTSLFAVVRPVETRKKKSVPIFDLISVSKRLNYSIYDYQLRSPLSVV